MLQTISMHDGMPSRLSRASSRSPFAVSGGFFAVPVKTSSGHLHKWIWRLDPNLLWMCPFTRFLLCLLQLLTWEPGKDKDVSVVIVRPNFQDSVHVGYVTGLKKFTEYYTSVLCFTTPGDGPRSPPRAARTHEDSEFFMACASSSRIHY